MKNFNKIEPVILASTMMVALSSCTNQKENVSEKKPLNIVYIMCDDHSYQTISAYGHPISKLAPTPNIDRLAAKGMIFQKAFVENSLSTPSRACLMTGLYSHQNGQRNLDKGIDTTKVFFSEILKENGYQTAVVGKWHMQCEPKGFDYYSVLWDQGDYHQPAFKTKETNGKYVKEKGYATDLITDHAIEFLENRNEEKPFCLLVHHKAPHRNWMPDLKYLNLYEDIEFPLPETFYDDYSTRTDPAHVQRMRIEQNMTLVYDLKVHELGGDKNVTDDIRWVNNAWKGSLDRMTDDQKEQWISAYKDRNNEFIKKNLKGKELLEWKYQRYIKDYMRCIKSIDDQVGRLIDYLEKEKLMDNTVIVYTSDQGFYMGEHGWFDKRFMYEESFRTPLIICSPNSKKGSSCDALVQNIDYAPTILDFAGIDKPEHMEGASLLPLLEGKVPENWRKDLYYHYYDAGHHVCRHDGVRDNRYKLIHFYGSANGKAINSNEFYDLEKDPNELNNLYDNPDYQSQIIKLQERLDKYRKDLKVDEF